MSFETATPAGSVLKEKQPHNVRGLAYMALAFFIFAAADTQAKFLTSSLDPIQIAWTRQLGLLSFVIILLVVKGRRILKSSAPLLQLSRGTLAAISFTLFIFGVKYVPLADAVSVTFIAPFVVILLGALLLRETVKVHHILSVIFGFTGILIVIRPGLGVFHPAILFVLMAAVAFAFRQILSRKLASSDRIVTTIAFTGLTSSALLTIPLPLVWSTPETWREVALLAGLAICAGSGELLIIRALEMADAVVLAPMHYTLILWATMYGWLVFGQLPDFWTWMGTAIIVATGLYILARERAATKAKRD